jgi:hypothetical protein
VNAAGTLAFGGGGIAIVVYFAYQYGKVVMENHKAELERVCESFDRALDRRDNDIAHIMSALHLNQQSGIKSGVFNNGNIGNI